MYVLVSRVGNNFGILDTSDGVLDWLFSDTALRLVKQGVRIQGIEGGNIKPQDAKLVWDCFKWNNGNNIFTTGRRLTIDIHNKFSFIAGRKSYKGYVLGNDGINTTIRFSFGVITTVPNGVFNAMKTN